MKKHTRICFFLLFSVFVCYLLFFMQRIGPVVRPFFEDEKGHNRSILVGVSKSAREQGELFFKSVKEEAFKHDAVSNMLSPSRKAELFTLKDCIEYARYYSPEGMIFFSDSETFLPEPLFNVHGKEIPVVVAGFCSPSCTLPRIYVSTEQAAEKLTTLLSEKSEWKKIVFFQNDEWNPKYFSEVAAGVKKSAGNEKDIITIHRSKSSREKQIWEVLESCVNREHIDAIVCFSPLDLNNAAQALVDMNIAGKIGLLGVLGTQKSIEYLNKSIITAILEVDFEEYGRKCSELLFDTIENGVKVESQEINLQILRGEKQ